MDDTLYLVTCDGYTDEYGSAILLIGIFTTEAQAIAVADQVNSYINRSSDSVDSHCRITRADKDVRYMIRPNGWGDYTNDKYLGGYIE